MKVHRKRTQPQKLLLGCAHLQLSPRHDHRHLHPIQTLLPHGRPCRKGARLWIVDRETFQVVGDLRVCSMVGQCLNLALSRCGSIEVFDTGQDSESSEDYKASGVPRYTKYHDRSKIPPYRVPPTSQFRTSTFLCLSFTFTEADDP